MHYVGQVYVIFVSDKGFGLPGRSVEISKKRNALDAARTFTRSVHNIVTVSLLGLRFRVSPNFSGLVVMLL